MEGSFTAFTLRLALGWPNLAEGHPVVATGFASSFHRGCDPVRGCETSVSLSELAEAAAGLRRDDLPPTLHVEGIATAASEPPGVFNQVPTGSHQPEFSSAGIARV